MVINLVPYRPETTHHLSTISPKFQHLLPLCSTLKAEEKYSDGAVIRTQADVSSSFVLRRNGRVVRGCLGLENASREDIRLIAVAYGFFTSVVQIFLLPDFNPFGPAHKVP